MASSGEIRTRLIPSLLDRLTDTEPARNIDATGSRMTDLRARKLALARDLSDLLNTKRTENPIPPEVPECADSLLSFGIPDYTALSLKSPFEQNRLRKAIERAIQRFEPRLSGVTVTVEPRSDLDPVLRFRVDALLKLEPAPERIRFDTVLQADIGHIVVEGAN